MAAVFTPDRDGLLPRLLAGPAAVSRSSRRLTRAGLFVAETLAHVGASPATTIDNVLTRARLLTWVAENMCALHGIQVVARGRCPAGPAVLVANHLSYIDPLAVLAHLSAAVVAKREVSEWPILGDAMRGLGVLWVDRACALSGACVSERRAGCSPEAARS